MDCTQTISYVLCVYATQITNVSLCEIVYNKISYIEIYITLFTKVRKICLNLIIVQFVAYICDQHLKIV